MSDVSSVVNHFPTANEGFNSSLSSTVLSGATIVPLSNVTGLTDESVFVGIVEPGATTQQVFTGTVDLTGGRIINVVWTRGSNVDHATGSQVVDYVTGTAINMITKGISVTHDQDGTIRDGVAINAPVITNASAAHLISPEIETSINDVNSNELIKFPLQASAVNELTVRNTVTGTYPVIEASGGDTNIGLNLKTKGSPTGGGMQFNGVNYRIAPKDWTRILFPWGILGSVGSTSMATVSGVTFPSNGAAMISTGGADADLVQYKVYLDAGTYTFQHYFLRSTGKGICQFGIIDIDNTGGTTTFSGIDTYNGSAGQVSGTISGVSIPHGGYHVLQFKANGKNASSSGYTISYFGTNIFRTA